MSVIIGELRVYALFSGGYSKHILTTAKKGRTYAA